MVMWKVSRLLTLLATGNLELGTDASNGNLGEYTVQGRSHLLKSGKTSLRLAAPPKPDTEQYYHDLDISKEALIVFRRGPTVS